MSYSYYANKLEESVVVPKKEVVLKSKEFFVIEHTKLGFFKCYYDDTPGVSYFIKNLDMAYKFASYEDAKIIASDIKTRPGDDLLIEEWLEDSLNSCHEVNRQRWCPNIITATIKFQPEQIVHMEIGNERTTFEPYDITPQDGLDIVGFLRYVLHDAEYDRAINKIFEDFPQVDDSLTPIEIPKIYDIPDDVQESYNERGYRLVKKPS